MNFSVFLLWLVAILIHAHPGLASDPQGNLINCGGDAVTVGSLKYISDKDFINVGNVTTVDSPNVLPILSTLRYFPNKLARKYCYSIPVARHAKYLVKTTYYYGGFDGGKEPPVFDQIVEGTKWSIVNTTADYAQGLTSYYEVVVMSSGKKLSVCLARNNHTGHSSPFISALEVESLEGNVYNPTDFSKYALVTVARNTFGDEHIISFPDDKFNRMWLPFKDQNPVVVSQSNVTSSDFWNLPPVKAFGAGITTSRGKTLEIQWPPVSLPQTMYYIALYFHDHRSPSPYSWRVFDVAINGQNFYSKLNATANGVTVYSPQWPLSGQTKITLTPDVEAPVGPVISAGEIFQIMPLAGRTMPRDVVAMEDLARSFHNAPPDWSGDPCLPKENSWTGVTCSYEAHTIRVSSIDLTNTGLSGSLPSSISNLTAIDHLWLGQNNLSGTIPDLSALKDLQTLHLENNQLEGPFPESLGKLPNLREILLHGNKLDGKVPAELQNRSGVKVLLEIF
ncbi:hypothetical protein L6164_035669 [Bauhinia variegata]|uniref:Uncharacterized protein n=1 Tax=Bauhinia variegata TaxID=167791 RepID=A0ACB9KEP9_BAUVA|nr:hypothetical protein L6164_035669 [Bauhinia variegata]